MDKAMHLKLDYRRQLRPLLQMLLHKRGEVSEVDWIQAVKQTEQRILETPGEYLTDLPEAPVLELIVHGLFAEFLEEHMYRESHKSDGAR